MGRVLALSAEWSLNGLRRAFCAVAVLAGFGEQLPAQLPQHEGESSKKNKGNAGFLKFRGHEIFFRKKRRLFLNSMSAY